MKLFNYCLKKEWKITEDSGGNYPLRCLKSIDGYFILQDIMPINKIHGVHGLTLSISNDLINFIVPASLTINVKLPFRDQVKLFNTFIEAYTQLIKMQIIKKHMELQNEV